MGYRLGEPTVQQYVDVNGDPLSGGTVEFYIWNTSTPTPVYSDSVGTSVGTSVTLNTLGAPTNGGGAAIALFFDDNVTYKIIRKDAGGSAISPTIGPYTVTPFTPATIVNFIGVVADMVADTTLIVGDIVQTTGYWANGDEGSNRYEIVAAATGTADNGSFITLDNGLQAKALFPNGYYNVVQWGVKADGATNNSTRLTACMTYMGTLTPTTLHFPAGEIGIGSTFTVGDGDATQMSTVHQGIRLQGASTNSFTGAFNDLDLDPVGGTILKWVGAAGYGPVVNLAGPISLTWDGISIDGNDLAEQGLHTNHIHQTVINNVNIRKYTSAGMWMFAYPNAADPAAPYNGTYGVNLISTGSGANVVSNVYINSFGDALAKVCLTVGNAEAPDAGSSDFGHDVNQTQFTNVSLISNGVVNGSALVLHYTDTLEFNKCFVYSPVAAVPALRVIAPTTTSTARKSFPSQVRFFGCAISSEVYSSDWLGGTENGAGLSFYGLSSERASTAPTFPQHYGVYGYSDSGTEFGKNQHAIENYDTGVANHLKLWYSPTMLYRDAAFHQLTNDASATAVWSYTVPAEILAIKSTESLVITDTYDRYLRVLVFGSILNNTGAPQTFRIRIYLGTVLTLDATATLGASANYRPVRVEFDLKPKLDVNNFAINGRMTIGDGSAAATAATPVGHDLIQTTSNLAFGAGDLSDAQVLAVQVTLGVASANMTFAGNGFSVELL